jgi:hypothetical protein
MASLIASDGFFERSQDKSRVVMLYDTKLAIGHLDA